MSIKNKLVSDFGGNQFIKMRNDSGYWTSISSKLAAPTIWLFPPGRPITSRRWNWSSAVSHPWFLPTGISPCWNTSARTVFSGPTVKSIWSTISSPLWRKSTYSKNANLPSSSLQWSRCWSLTLPRRWDPRISFPWLTSIFLPYTVMIITVPWCISSTLSWTTPWLTGLDRILNPSWDWFWHSRISPSKPDRLIRILPSSSVRRGVDQFPKRIQITSNVIQVGQKG